MGLCFFMYFFKLPDDGFSQKPKHAASNKTDEKLNCDERSVLLLPVHVSQQDVNDKTHSPDTILCHIP